MWKYVQSVVWMAITISLSACAGGGTATVPAVRQPQTASGPRFTASALPAGFVPQAMMHDGEIAGAQGTAAAIFSNGRVSVLPSLPGATNAVALWVNSRGHAVGYTAFDSPTHPLVATLFAGGTARNLNPQAPARQAEAADVIGEQDQIYGTSDTVDFLNSLDLVRFMPAGGYTHLSPVNGQRAAGFIYDINDSGRFAGYEWPEEIPFNLGTQAMTGQNLAVALSPTDFFTSVNTAIDNAGDVAGYVDPSNSTFNTSGEWQAFVRTRNGTSTFIPPLAGSTNMIPAGINNRGDVVGTSNPFGTNAAAFFYTKGAVYDVGSRSTPALDGVETVVHGLSNSGRFVVQTQSGYYLVHATGGP